MEPQWSRDVVGRFTGCVDGVCRTADRQPTRDRYDNLIRYVKDVVRSCERRIGAEASCRLRSSLHLCRDSDDHTADNVSDARAKSVPLRIAASSCWPGVRLGFMCSFVELALATSRTTAATVPRTGQRPQHDLLSTAAEHCTIRGRVLMSHSPLAWQRSVGRTRLGILPSFSAGALGKPSQGGRVHLLPLSADGVAPVGRKHQDFIATQQVADEKSSLWNANALCKQ